MLGGLFRNQRSVILQKCINKIIQIPENINNNNKSRHYRQLLNNIICNDVCFGLQPNAGEPCLDLFIDKLLHDGDGLIVGVQHIKKFLKSDIVIGVFAIGINSNNRWFVMNTSEMENNQSKFKIFIILLRDKPWKIIEK